MRINVYSQEIDLVRIPELVTTEGYNEKGERDDFLGIRFFLISPESLHHTPADDDQSAVTFWFPNSSRNRLNLSEHFRYASHLVAETVI